MWFKKNKKVIQKELITKTFNMFFGGETNSVTSILAQQKQGLFAPVIRTYIRLYQEIEPLANAVDLIATTMSNIQLKLFDTNAKEFVDDHPILELLKSPNPLPNTNYCNFISEISKFYSITGNNFIIVTLSSGKEPLELFTVPPQYLEWVVGDDGFITSYIYTPQGKAISFERDEEFRYFNKDGTQQLLHLKDFNPDAFNMYTIGLSRLNSILFELMQYRSASVHNLGLLENGVRPSGFIKSKGDSDGFTTEDHQAVTAQLENMFTGSSNAGRILMTNLFESFEMFSLNNVDMDFATLKTMVTEAIYNRLQIPLALINSTSLSLANMETARLNLYDFSVLPQLKTVLSFLTDNLMPYYKGSENLILTYDSFTIDALRQRAIEETSKMAALNVMSDNEIRNRLDLNDYKEGIDVYKPSNLVPVGTTDGD